MSAALAIFLFVLLVIREVSHRREVRVWRQLTTDSCRELMLAHKQCESFRKLCDEAIQLAKR